MNVVSVQCILDDFPLPLPHPLTRSRFSSACAHKWNILNAHFSTIQLVARLWCVVLFTCVRCRRIVYAPDVWAEYSHMHLIERICVYWKPHNQLFVNRNQSYAHEPQRFVKILNYDISIVQTHTFFWSTFNTLHLILYICLYVFSSKNQLIPFWSNFFQLHFLVCCFVAYSLFLSLSLSVSFILSMLFCVQFHI